MVKLSYYFPTSSDSISLKQQLLESGVLDKTNERIYRMAPEAVDPSILSRGSLSFRRYTRSALLMLRDDKLSNKHPICLSDPRLFKFDFWKVNKFNSSKNNKNINTNNIIKPEKSRRNILSTIQSSSTYKNNTEICYPNSKNTTIKNWSSEKYPAKFISQKIDIEGEGCNVFFNGSQALYVQRNKNKINFPLVVSSKESDAIKSNPETFNKEFFTNSGEDDRYRNKRTTFYQRDKSFMMSSLSSKKIDKPVDFLCVTNNFKIINQNKYNTHISGESGKAHMNSSDFDKEHRFATSKFFQVNLRSNEPYGFGSDQIETKQKNHQHIYKGTEQKFPERYYENQKQNYQSNKKYNYYNIKISNDNKYNFNRNKNNVHNQYGMFDHKRYIYRYRKNSRSSSEKSGSSEEPEWLTCGPTSKNDIIELRGFDDDPASDTEVEEKNEKSVLKANIKCQYSSNSINDKSCEKQINKMKEKKMVEKHDKNNTSGKISITTSNFNRNVNVTSSGFTLFGCNDEMQTVGANRVPSPPPARSTPTKLKNDEIIENEKFQSRNDDILNSKNNNIRNTLSMASKEKGLKSSDQINFDNFLDYPTINKILVKNKKHRFGQCFKESNREKKEKNKSFINLEEHNLKLHDGYTVNAINVKDLEDEIRGKTDFYKYFPHQNNIKNKKTNVQYEQKTKYDEKLKTFEEHMRSQLVLPESNISTSINPSVNAFAQSAYSHMLVQANSIVKRAKDPEIVRRFFNQLNSVNHLSALSELSKPSQLQHSQFFDRTEKQRIPSTQELEFHTRHIVQNALLRKRVQDQQIQRLQDLKKLTAVHSNLNSNASKFTPSMLRNCATGTLGSKFNWSKIEQYPNLQSFSKEKQLQYQTNPYFQNYQQKSLATLDKFNNFIPQNSILDHGFYEKQEHPIGNPIINKNLMFSKFPFINMSISNEQQRDVDNGFDQFLKKKYSYGNEEAKKLVTCEFFDEKSLDTKKTSDHCNAVTNHPVSAINNLEHLAMAHCLFDKEIISQRFISASKSIDHTKQVNDNLQKQPHKNDQIQIDEEKTSESNDLTSIILTDCVAETL